MITYSGRNNGKSYAQATAIADTKKYHSRIRYTHPYGFRKGEWATITGLISLKPRGLGERLCYQVVYDDGVKDHIALADQCNFEVQARLLTDNNYQPFECWVDELDN